MYVRVYIKVRCVCEHSESSENLCLACVRIFAIPYAPSLLDIFNDIATNFYSTMYAMRKLAETYYSSFYWKGCFDMRCAHVKMAMAERALVCDVANRRILGCGDSSDNRENLTAMAHTNECMRGPIGDGGRMCTVQRLCNLILMSIIKIR